MSQRSWYSRILTFAAALILALPALASAAPPRAIPGELIIRYKSGATPTARAAYLSRLGASRLRAFPRFNMDYVKLSGISTEEALRRYSLDPSVEYIEPNYEIHLDAVPNDPRFPELYGMRNTGQTGGTPGADIKATNAWDVFTGDPNIKIGIIDTGVDYNHPDLAANVWTNPGEIPGNSLDDDGNGYVDDVHGYDFSNNDGDPFDDNGHGSHCAGTIAGVGDNNVGVVGVNWHAKVIAIKFLNAGGSGSTAGAIAGVQYAIAVGCRLTSNSWGGGGFSQALLDVINQAGATGQLFVAAAGNASSNTDVSPSYPASYDSPYIISVAATDHNDNLASFSNYGATTVDLAAPGVSILSCQPGGGYQLLSGTSMATPHVAGVVGLAMGRFPSATNLFIKQLVLNAADVKPQLAGKCLTGGRLNAFLTIADPDTTEPGSVADLAVTGSGSSHLSLTWTATGDDGGTGRASAYDLRWSTSPITEANFAAATPVAGPDPQPAGGAEAWEIGGLAFSTTYYVALKALDEFGNTGGLSNVATGTTLGAPDLAASPGTFAATLLTGAAETQTLTLSNVGQGTLDFTIPTPDLMFTQPVRFEYVPLAKGADDIRVGQPVTTGTGGPDGFGYRWIDSNEPGGPSFAWEDITGTGAQLTLSGDDATSAAVPIGFDFPYYGGTFNSLRVCTNGWLSFTSGATAYDNQQLPNAGAPDNLVAPMWDDMDFGSTNRVYTYGDASHFVVSWIGVPHYQSGGPYTFQAILYTTGEIRFQYQTIGAPANGATVGIQNGTRSIGLTTAFNTDYIADGLAVRILPLRQWLTVSPTAGRIAAGQSQNLNVVFNALGVEGGIFDGNIRIDSNDPDENPTVLPAQLHVLGAPDIALSPATVDFGTFFVGANPTRTLSVNNPGTDALIVSGITSSDPDVQPDVTSFTLNPHQTRNVVLTFSPATTRTLSGTVTVASNDPDTPNLSVNLVGQSVPAPVVTAAPDSFDVALLTNTATSQTLRLTNNGGSNYDFTAAAEILGQSGTVTVHGDADNVDVPKGGTDTQFGPAPARAGGPDVFGYTYQDSDEPGGPAFSWVDISSTGTPIPLNGDDQNLGPFPIGFSFPHYGANYPSFRICSNGWLTLNATATQTSYSNLALPNSASGAPPSLLAVFWDDLSFSPTTSPNGRAYYQYDGTRTIIQYQSVSRLGDSASPNTFEVILYPTGEVVYQYLTMNAVTKNSATIGMQNAAKDDGLQVVYNALYVKNDLAIRFRPPARFLTVSPPSGSITPGNFLDLTVGFNAAGLFGGTYDGQVHVTGNDPVRPVINVPATLVVTGVPDVATNPDTIPFGDTFIGFPKLRQLQVQNVGTDVLNVSGIVSSDPAYGVDQSTFSVPPLGQALLFVTFNPPDAAAHPATLTISSNDPDTPDLVVTLDGAGIVAPDVDPQPASLAQALPIPGTASQTLTLQNLGGSNLDFVVGALLTAASVPHYEWTELGKDETDTRPGVLGSGGPDVFGYRWVDSDDPDGPAFDWVDITTIGTPVTLPGSGDDANATGIPLGFSFPFYGSTYSTVNVCSNGWLSFTSTATSLSNSALPASGAPENLLAPFWDDLNPGSGTTRLWRYSDGTRFILSYVGVPRYGSGGPYTFQVILYPSGRIVYQYLDMQGTRLNEATVGIQNGAGDDGLTVVFNDAYVHDGLAVQLSVLPEYLTVSPSTGTIPAGGSAALNVNFNTNGLFGGTYDGAIRIASNDPDEGVKLVPTHLTAVGTPHIGAQPAALDFGSLYVGLTADRSVSLRNVGSDPLTITGLSLDNATWAVTDAPAFPVTLGQNGSLPLTVRWTPTAACAPCTGNLLVASNDPDAATLAVPLTGVGVIPPEIGVTPDTLKAALATTLGPTALTTTKKLVIVNTGGSDLDWTAQALSALPASLASPSAEAAKNDAGAPGILGNGGPDAFGYRWVDSDDPFGPAFSWEDISAVGTPIAFTGDDQNLGWIHLPFSFPFYGSSFDSIRVCTNGWLSFSSTLTSYSNSALPSGGTSGPENLIAPFWDDLTFSSSGDAYYHYDGTKFIVSFVAVPHLSSGGPYTFQVLLYPSGTIDFQYLDMQGDRLDEATVGIQNATRDVGLQVVYNAAYVKNNLRVRLTNRPGWLTVSPPGGTTPAGERDTVLVTFDATGLADGDYSGLVRVASNDLDEPLVSVPADLHVGVVAAKVRIEPGVLNRASWGRWVLGKAWAPQGMDARKIVRSSLLLQRTVPADPWFWQCFEDGNEPVFGWRWWAWFKFNRQALLDVLPDGNKVMVEMIGRVDDTSWFQGWDSVRVLRPRVCWGGGWHATNPDQPMPNSINAQAIAPLQLVDPAGATATRFELWYSPDAGETWSPIDTMITSRDFSWVVPEDATDQAMLEVVAWDDEGVMGSRVTNLFAIMNGTTDVDDRPAPDRFSMRLAGRNPAAKALLEFGMPVAGHASVRVFDVRGALVRELAGGTYAAGWHRLSWDGSGASGAPAQPGVYFVQANAGGQRLLSRFVLLK